MLTNTEEQKIEKAQKAYEQARAKYENAKKKQNEKQRKRENHYKCMMGGIVKKYFPECMSYEEHELNEILSAALATSECKNVIARITREAGQTAKTSVDTDTLRISTVFTTVIVTEKEAGKTLYFKVG